MTGRFKAELFSWLKTLGLAFIIVILCRQFVFSPTMVHGESMLPTFENKDRVFVTKISKIDRFDIIVFDAPDDDTYYVKRVIGLPGDHVEVKNNILYINGKRYKEPYLQGEDGHGMFTGDFTLEEVTGESKVPPGSFFVLGDNRPFSKDSRIFGFISKDTIFGEVKFRYPF